MGSSHEEPSRELDRDARGERREGGEAEDVLARSGAFCHLVLESIEDYAIFTIDRGGHFTGWNPGAERLFGYRKAEILGRHVSLLFTPEDLAEGADRVELDTASREGRVADERWQLRKDGSRFWATGVTTALRDDDGHLIGFAKMARDLTERRRAQAEVLQAKLHLEAAIRASGLLFFDWIPATNEISYGSGLEQFIGYSAEEMRGGADRWLGLVHPQDRARFRDEVESALRARAAIHVSYRYVRKDGEVRNAETHGYLLRSAPGNRTHVVGFLHDVTERKRAEERIRMFESVVTSANDAILVTSAEPIDEPGPLIVYVNDAFTRMTGHSAHEVLGRSPRFLQGAETDPAARAKIRTALQRQEHVRVELQNHRKDGSPFWVELNIVPVRNAAGRLTHWASVQRDTTARREAEETARRLSREEAAHAQAEEARRQVETILESITDAFVAVDAEGRFTYVNRRAGELLSCSPAECIGKHVRDVYPELDREALTPAVREALRRGESIQHETHVPRLGVWLGLHAYPSGGGFSLYIRDVTERRRAEAAQRRLAAILETTPDLVATMDPRGTLLSLNQAGRRMLGLGTTEEIVGRSVLELLPEWAASRVVREAIPAAIRAGTWTGESAVLGPGDREVPVSQVFIAHRGPDHGVEYLSTICRDIAERKRAEEVDRFLSEASRTLSGSLEYEQVVRSVPRLLVPLLADFCILNLGGSNGDVRRIAMLHRDPDKAPLLDALRPFTPQAGGRLGVPRVLRTGEPELVPEVTGAWLRAVSRSDEHLRAIQALRITSELIVPLRARGRVIGAITCDYAESGRRYTEEDVIIIEDLAGRVALALENANLFRQTQQAVRARDEVLRIVAHDLRNPLHGIMLGAQHLLRRLPEERAECAAERAQLGLIRRQVERADALIDDLLDVARAQAGRLTVERTAEAPAALMQQSVELHGPLAAEKGVQLAFDVAPDLPRISVDRRRILQVLANLIGNALKFTGSGGRVTVRADSAGDEVRIFVTDTGPGIPADQLPHLFDPFWQARTGTRDGAGLGLAIAKGIIDAHGGRLWVESEEGKGTTFAFSIPID